MISNEIELGEAPIEIVDGDRGSNYPKQNEFLSEGYCLFLNAKNVTADGFRFEENQFISEDKDLSLRKGKAKRNDIILTTRGTLGNVAWYANSVAFENIRINSGMVLIRAKGSEITAEFLYVFFRSQRFIDQVQSLKSGVAQPQLPIRDIKRIKIPIPKPSVQNSISKIIKNYDDLIENNRRRIALLEKSARLLYREWFVHFRFPEVKQPNLDEKPNNIFSLTFDDLCAFENGFAFKNSTYEDNGKYKIVTIKNVHEAQFIAETESTIGEVPQQMPRHCSLSEGDILLSLTGNVGRACIVYGNDFLLNQRVAKVKPKIEEWRPFLYWLFNNSTTQTMLENLSSGVAQLNLSPVKLKREEIYLPPSEVIEQFCELTRPIFDQIVVLWKSNHNLTKARDLLLPRLMDGRITL